MRNFILLIALLFGLQTSTLAVEGMWIPSFQFNGGCTAEIVSNEGLILTNHHCGFSAIQSHSSLENDYLKKGFWAKNNKEELACPWLRVTFVKEIRDVTSEILGSNGDNSAEMIKNKLKALEEANSSGTVIAKIKPFNLGNQYYMLITEDFNDIRLVGAPPSAIGKFGGDTDNWVWPRHTGDFSVFRIYANKNNASAKYDENNIPYVPKKALPISLKPKKQGDFTMVYGFPGSTDQHYVSGKLKFYMDVERPARIKMRQSSLDIIKPAMNGSDQIRIQYASKQARIANAWKKWIGQIGGLKELHAIDRKRSWEEEYLAKAAEQTKWKDEYFSTIADLNKLQNDYQKYEFAHAMFIEYFYVGPEFIRYAFDYATIATNYEQLNASGKLSEEIEKLKNKQKSFFKNYNKQVDQKIFEALTPLYISYVDSDLLPSDLENTWKKQGERIFEKSLLLNQEKLVDALNKFNKGTVKKIKKDPAYQFALKVYSNYVTKVSPKYRELSSKEEPLMKKYVKGILEMFPDKKVWADANSTLRITYGKLDGSAPRDGMQYTHYTTIDGIMQKYDPENPDFQLTQEFIDLYKKDKDYGKYGQDGELWVCFTASNHTTGGNSGSPVIDAEGNLMGINFDRSWESTMSDFMFDESRCRNIIVDIRYVLWVIDKYGDAGHLIDEMTFVN